MKYLKILYVQVLIGIAIGVVAGGAYRKLNDPLRAAKNIISKQPPAQTVADSATIALRITFFKKYTDEKNAVKLAKFSAPYSSLPSAEEMDRVVVKKSKRLQNFVSISQKISETFIGMIKMLIAPIIFLTVVTGIAGIHNMKKMGRVGVKGILYFEIVTTIALAIGFIVANIVKPGSGVEHEYLDAGKVAKYAEQAKEMNWLDFFTHIVPHNIVEAFATADILQILFVSVLFGVALSNMGHAGQSLNATLEKLSKVFFGIMKIVMKLAPVGAMAGIAFTISKFGLSGLLPLGKLMISMYVTMFIFIFGVLNAICYYYKFSLWKLLGYIKDELLIVLGTSTSESVLPNIMEKLEAAGCGKSVVGLIVPTGYTFNLDGTSIYLSMAVMFLAQVFNIDLSIGQQLTIMGILMLTSKGAGAVTGAGFIVLASTLPSIPGIPSAGLALLLGIDRFMSEGRSITNLIGNTVASVIISKSENEFDAERYKAVVEERRPIQLTGGMEVKVDEIER
jgi:aerobic C4-dicarboxylate transport protein